jgi:hypothetical protein
MFYRELTIKRLLDSLARLRRLTELAQMLNKLMFQLMFSGIVALISLTVNWLVLADSSPFHEHFLWHTGLPNWWLAMNIFPAIGSAVIAGNPHSGSEIVYGLFLVIQWFIFGFLLSRLLLALGSRKP